MTKERIGLGSCRCFLISGQHDDSVLDYVHDTIAIPFEDVQGTWKDQAMIYLYGFVGWHSVRCDISYTRWHDIENKACIAELLFIV